MGTWREMVEGGPGVFHGCKVLEGRSPRHPWMWAVSAGDCGPELNPTGLGVTGCSGGADSSVCPASAGPASYHR